MFHADRGGSISVRGRIGSPYRAAVELLLGQVGQTDGQTDGRIAASLNAPYGGGVIIPLVGNMGGFNYFAGCRCC